MQQKCRIGEVTVESSQPISSWLAGVCKDAYLIQKKLFSSRPRRVRVVVAHNHPEWRSACGDYYFPVARATVLRDGTIVLKSRRMSACSRNWYRQIIVHEMSHAFWSAALEGTREKWTPFWLLEALACRSAENHYLLEQSALSRKLRNPDALPIPYRYTAKTLRVKSRRKLALLYSYWSCFADWISRGRQERLYAFFEAFRRSPSRRNYEKLFRSYFGVGSAQAAARFWPL